MAKGDITPQGTQIVTSNQQVDDPAFQQAVHNIYDTVLKLRIDNHKCAGSLLTENRAVRIKIDGMAAASKVVHVEKDPSGRGAVSVQMSIYGGFAQLVLPPEIRQVQSIRPLNGSANDHVFSTRDVDPSSAVVDPDAYTGLIVDARGTGAKPLMVPLLLDEKGHEVFGPAYVSREFAVQHGVCQYIRLADNGRIHLPRVAPRPLVIKGLKTDGPGSGHIVISNTDVSKLHGAVPHLEFLKQCRVIIILD
jgi:hypothetical protein